MSIEIALVGVPTDIGAGGRGASMGPQALRVAGLREVELKIYPQARHELLNESNRDEVTTYLRDWLGRALARSRTCTHPIEEPV